MLLKGVDFWAFGILIYEMLCGGTPFADEEHSRIFVKIVHSQVEFVLIGCWENNFASDDSLTAKLFHVGFHRQSSCFCVDFIWVTSTVLPEL